jgi:uncharacterized protein (UPF0264 family)
MKVLISIRSLEELQPALEGKADIIDLKNPSEGSLGAAVPSFIKKVKKLALNDLVSAAIGDMPNLPGTAALAALGAATSGADYVKVGLFGVTNEKEGIKLLTEVVNAVKEYNSNVIVVGAGYADSRSFGGVDPMKIPNIVKSAGAKVAMLDTATKDGRKLFDFLNYIELKSFVDNAHNLNLLAALAGSLDPEDLFIINKLGTDITGFRGAACSNKDRNTGIVTTERVANIMKIANIL